MRADQKKRGGHSLRPTAEVRGRILGGNDHWKDARCRTTSPSLVGAVGVPRRSPLLVGALVFQLQWVLGTPSPTSCSWPNSSFSRPQPPRKKKIGVTMLTPYWHGAQSFPRHQAKAGLHLRPHWTLPVLLLSCPFSPERSHQNHMNKNPCLRFCVRGTHTRTPHLSLSLPPSLSQLLTLVLLKIGAQNKRHYDTDPGFHWLHNFALDFGTGVHLFLYNQYFSLKACQLPWKGSLSYPCHRFPQYLILLMWSPYRIFLMSSPSLKASNSYLSTVVTILKDDGSVRKDDHQMFLRALKINFPNSWMLSVFKWLWFVLVPLLVCRRTKCARMLRGCIREGLVWRLESGCLSSTLAPPMTSSVTLSY